MATASGVYSGRSQYSLVQTVNQTSQNISANTSTVSVSLQIVETTEWGSWSNGTLTWSSNVNGSTNSGSRTGYDFGGASDSYTLLSTSKTIAHNSDGKKTISFSASSGGGTIVGSASCSGSLTLTTIPRASTSTWASGTKYIGTAYTINTNRASTSFTHTITYAFGTQSGTVGTGVGASVSWTPPLSLLNEIPNSVTGTGTFTTKTYSGSTLIGTKTSSFTLTANTDIIPTWTSVAVSEGNSTVTTKMGAGVYVQGVSKASYTISGAAGVYGSTITAQTFSVGSQTVSGASGTTPGTIDVSGTVPVTWTITDSRGRTKTQTANITVRAYTPPLITSMVASRATSTGVIDPENGTYLKIQINASVTSLINSTEKNSIQIRVRSRTRGSTTPWTDASTLKSTLTPGGLSYNNTAGPQSSLVVTGPYASSTAYDIRVEAIDIFNTSASQSAMPVGTVFMHWGTGLAVGKYWEQGALDVNGDIYSSTAVRAPALYQNGRKTLSLQQTLYFTSSGTFTKATYPWLQAIRVRAVGGGGSGGGASSASGGQNSYGTGGGSGAYAESFITDIAGLASSVSIAVGSGGAATAAGAINGNAGSASSFGTAVVAGGGGGGLTKANSALGGYVQGGNPGVATAGDIQQGGSPGDSGSGRDTLCQAGNGGSSIFGGGGWGEATASGGGARSGNPGTAWGAGGSGAAVNASGTAQPSGAGAGGVVIVELYA